MSGSHPLADVVWVIGDPPTYDAIDEAWSRSVFGERQPQRGEVHPDTYHQMLENAWLDSRANCRANCWLRFRGAVIIPDIAMQRGELHWSY